MPRSNLTALLGVIVFVSGCADRGRELAVEADELLYAGRYEAAASQLEVVLHELGERSDARSLALRRKTLVKLGEIRQHYLNDPRGALAAYRVVSTISPEHADAFEARLRSAALLRDRLDDPAAAAGELAALLGSHPKDPRLDEVRLDLAKLSFASRNYVDAVRYAEGLAQAGPVERRIEAGTRLAAAYEIQGKVELALETYRAMLKLSPRAPVVARIRFEIAHCHERLGNLDLALERYQQAKSGNDEALVESRIARVRQRIENAKAPEGRARTHARAPVPVPIRRVATSTRAR